MAGGLTPEMRARLAELGFRPKRRMGQNFMRDGNMLAALAGEAGVTDGGLVLEPGPGAGGLTAELLDRGAEVVAVELDPVLAEFLRARFDGRDRLRLIEGDVLGPGRGLNREALAALAGRHFRVASNLPYSAATPFIIALPGAGPGWLGGAVTVQTEVAERLCAAPGEPDYGAATVLVGVRAKCALVRRVPPDVFWPKPRVESAILGLEPPDEPYLSAEEFDGFAGFVRGLFSARRKKLTQALSVAGLERERAAPALKVAGVDGGRRPGEVSPEEMLALWRAARPDLR